MYAEKLGSQVIYSLVLFKLLLLLGCAANTSNLLNEANDKNHSIYNICIKPELFAVTQPDGNVYIYDLCQKKSIQITKDSYPYTEKHQENGYYQFDSLSNWSPDGDNIIADKNSSTYIINIPNSTQKNIDSESIYTLWSPDSSKIATIEKLAKQHLDDNLPNNDLITIIDIQDMSNKFSFEGIAPTWVSNSKLIFFTVTEVISGRSFLHKVIEIDLIGQRKTLSPVVNTAYSPLNYGRLSTNKNYLAIYSESPPNVGVVNLSSSDIFQTKWLANKRVDTYYAADTYSWSPTHAVLAICTGGHGGTEILPQMALGAILLVKPNQPPSVFNSERCHSSRSRVSWHPSGEQLAFLNIDNTLSFISTISNSYLEIAIHPNTLKIDKGPWWSPSGNFIAVISENQVYVAEFNEELLEFEYVTDGVDIAWQPLQQN